MKHPKDDFITYMAAVTDRLQSQERLGTAHVYRSTLNRINELWKESIYRSRTSPPCGYRLSKTTC